MSSCADHSSISIFESSDAVAETVAKQLLSLSQSKTIVNIALSGGSTPKHIFGYIAHSQFASDIDWSNLHFWWGDERCVPPSDEQSNYGEAMRLLFSHVLIPAQNLHPIHGELSPEKACIEFKDEMTACLPMSGEEGAKQPCFDWIILGLGEDGHTASLFPAEVDYHSAQAAVIASHPESQQPRISLSAAAICEAQRVTFLALGVAKQKIISEILNNEQESKDYPAANIMSVLSASGKDPEWYLDKQAAAGL
jgi:6-phosphogluconolactonase